MQHTRTRIFAVIILILLTTLSLPSRAGQGDGPYVGQKIVEVQPQNEAQLQDILSIGTSMHCEIPRGQPVQLAVDAAQLDRLMKLGLEPIVLVEDLQASVEAERRAIDAIRLARGNRDFVLGDDTFYETYHPLVDLHARINQLAQARPDLARVEHLGLSYEGRDISALVISGPGDSSSRPAIIWQGTQHAREWVSPATVLYIAENLVARYDDDVRVRRLVKNVEFWIVPIVNPDGYEYSWTDERFWRKNRRDNADHGASSFGVDLNRNWSFEWGGRGSSGFGGSNTYRGPRPFSEPETFAVGNLAASIQDRLRGFIDYHSFSQLIMGRWSYTPRIPEEPYATLYDTIGAEMAEAIDDTTGEPYRWGPGGRLLSPNSGVAPDWFAGELGAISLTVELRNRSTFALPPDQILPCARENFAAALVFAESTVGPLPTADLNADGLFNNTDIDLFIAAFLAGDPAADTTGDGMINAADINRFATLFLSGV